MMDIQNILDMPLFPWQVMAAPDADVVLSGRVRLARNFSDTLFTQKEDKESLKKSENRARQGTKILSSIDIGDVAYIRLEDLDETDRYALVEKHLISPQLLSSPSYRGLLVNEDASCAIMVNEEDHLRIQSMTRGLRLQEAWSKANQIDDALEGQFDFAFNDRLGYLTACPTNVGTGMRASLMVHVPGLVKAKKIRRIIQSIMKLNFSVRGIYGEGSNMLGNILQVSNQITLGISEESIVEGLENLGAQLIKEERKARTELYKQQPKETEDRIWRTYGVLKYARKLSSEEALNFLSDIELGRNLGILPNIPDAFFNKMMIITRPGFLQHYLHKPDLRPEERDFWRASVVRNELENIKE